MQDYLVKQGMTTREAETLLQTVTQRTDVIAFDVSMASQYIQSLCEHLPLLAADVQQVKMTTMPNLSQIYILDALIAKVCSHLPFLKLTSM